MVRGAMMKTRPSQFLRALPSEFYTTERIPQYGSSYGHGGGYGRY
jgi:hypothetical protein